jgi:hypothetical protein
MPLVTLPRLSGGGERPEALTRMLLDPDGRPKTSVRWGAAVAATAAFATAFAAAANAPRDGDAGAPAALHAAPAAVLSVADALPASSGLHRVALLPSLAPAPRRHHRHHHALTSHVASTPHYSATPQATVAPVPTTVPAAPTHSRSTAGKVFDSTG